MAHEVSLTRLPALSEAIIAIFAKPQTKWKNLAIASNEEVFKIYQTTGDIFFFIAAVSATGFILSLSSKKTNLLSISGFLAVGLALAGRVLRYLGNTSHILQQRDEVRDRIESFNSAHIRLTYPDKNVLKQRGEVRNNIEMFDLANIRFIYPDQNVISDQELNEWARYFLHTQPFEIFLHIHWRAICNFQHEPGQLMDDTRKLIRLKYFYRICHPENVRDLLLFSEVLDSGLFIEERKEIKEIQAIIREKQVQFSSLKDAWQKCIATPSLEISKIEWVVYAWFFTIDIWNEKIGIVELREKYGDALKKFTPYFTNYSPEQYIADRDAATLDYDKFVERNGEDAPKHISNVLHFLKLILQLNLGLNETNEMFKDAIASFSDEALIKQAIEQAVLWQEWRQLKNFTYTQFRERNGQKAILNVSDPAVRNQLKEKFLGLPPTQLAHTHKYEMEIKVLGVTEQEIDEKLSQTWEKMFFKDILKLEDTVKNKILGLAKKGGKTKAIEEIVSLPEADALDVYKLLCENGVLDSTDYAFTNRFENLSTEKVILLLESHGEYIVKLLKETDFVLTRSVSSFVLNKMEAFLNDKNLLENGVWKNLKDSKLIKEKWIELRNWTLIQMSRESNLNSKNRDTAEVKHKAKLVKIDLEVRAEQEKLEEKSKKCKTELLIVGESLRIRKEEQDAHLRSFEQWEENVVLKQEMHKLAKASLADKKEIKAVLDGIPERLSQLHKEHLRQMESLSRLEELLRERNRSSIKVTTIEKEKETLQEAIQALKEKKLELVDEHDKALEKLQSLEKLPIYGFDGQFDSSSYDISAVLLQTSEDRTDNSSDANQGEVEILKTLLDQIEKTIDDINVKVKARTAQFREKEQAFETAIEDFSQCAERRSLCEKIDSLDKEYRTLQTKQSELKIACSGLDLIQIKIDATASEIDLFPDERIKYEDITDKLEKEISKLQPQFNIAEVYSRQADIELHSVKTLRSKTLIAQEDKKYNKKVAKEENRYSAAKDKIKEKSEAQLNNMLR